MLRHGFDPFITSVTTKLPPLLRREIWYVQKYRRLGHLRHPRSFTEKVNWRILYDRRPILAWTCDKLRMKEEATRHGVRSPQTLWSGHDLRELVDVHLPDRWILKPNHRSELIYFGHGPVQEQSIHALETATKGWLDEFQTSVLGEWAYSQARRCLLVEEMIGGEEVAPPDYKFFVFDGLTHLIHMGVDRHDTFKMRPYTVDWKPMWHHTNGHPLAAVVEAPPTLDVMLDVSTRLGKPFDFMRIDLYSIGNTVYLGEYTPYPNGGWFPGWPLALDRDLGSVWKLPAVH